MLKIKFVLILLLIIHVSSFASETDSLINQLDNLIKNHSRYMESKVLKINIIKKQLREAEPNRELVYELNSQLFNEYKKYIFDSALYYLSQNLEIAETFNNVDWENETKFQMSHILSSSGMYAESINILESITLKSLPKKFVAEYYSCYEHVYNELSYYTKVQKHALKYRAISKRYLDSLLTILNPETDEYLRFKEQFLVDQNKQDEALNVNAILLSRAKEGTPEFAFVCFRRALLYRTQGKKELQIKFLALSAMSDIKSAIKDNASLTLLAMLLFENKEIDKAYEYILFSLGDAKFVNSRLRFIEISNFLPIINEAYQLKSEKQKKTLRLYLLLISILTLFLVLALVYIFMQIKRISKTKVELQAVNEQLRNLNINLNHVNEQLQFLNHDLTESNHIKEQYIGLFLSICSSYIDKLEGFRKLVHKKLVSGKTSELLEISKSTHLFENELHEFYDTFDNTFLHLYPDFVEKLNSLIINEERIVLKHGESLNTELRIFALIRLGITDSSKIASLLRYSVNTIYNYRVKIKNKAAVPRDDFEKMVKKIGTFSK